MVLLASKLTGCERQQSIGNFAIGRGQSGQRLFLDDTNLGFGDRLDGNAVLFSAFQSEDISCEIKTSNLPTSFSEHLRGAKPLTTSYTRSAGSSSRTIWLLRGYDLTTPMRKSAEKSFSRCPRPADQTGNQGTFGRRFRECTARS